MMMMKKTNLRKAPDHHQQEVRKHHLNWEVNQVLQSHRRMAKLLGLDLDPLAVLLFQRNQCPLLYQDQKQTGG